MSQEQSSLYNAILLSALIFFLIVSGLIFLVLTYNKRRKIHAIEKQTIKKEHEADLLKTQLEVQEQTMKTIAADLHDNIGQLLSLTSLTLGSIDIDDGKNARKLSDSRHLVQRSIKEMRQLANLLHGDKIMEKGLIHAIIYETEWLKKSGNFKVDVQNTIPGNFELGSEKDIIIFRLFQESVNNIIKHARATEITIILDHHKNNLILTATDNGVGFLPEAPSSGLGLSGLKKRTKSINGDIEIISAPGRGTTVAFKIEYP